MIWALSLLLAVQDAPVDDEIVVVGRIEAMQMSFARDGEGRLHCSLSDTSGIADLDDRLCKAGARCVKKYDADYERVGACFREGKSALIAHWKRQRERNAK